EAEGAGLTAHTAEIPESVRDMVRWRLGRVSDECAEVLEIASVIGERFDAALVASAAARDEDAVADLLDEAARTGLITEIDEDPAYGGSPPPLAGRVRGAGVSRGRRPGLPQRMGETLDPGFGVPPAELAHHFGAAASIGSADKAVGYERLAGHRALGE